MKIDIFNYKILILTIIISFLFGCANTPHFVIQNKSDKVIEVQFHYDSINLNKAVLNDLNLRYGTSDNQWGKYGNLVHQINTGEKVEYVREYCYDSLKLYQLIDEDLNVEELSSNIPYQKKFPLLSKKLPPNDTLISLFDYYLNDSTYVERLINENILTIFIPPNQVFYKRCQSGCGSCSIMESFPNVKKVEVIMSKDDIVTLTPKNFLRIMKEEKFLYEENSRILLIE